jgi:proton-dependent oligopeptide transporter, POT family
MEIAKKKASFWEQVFGLPANFWVACFMEILERLAFFGSRAVAPLYLVASSSQNGLALTYTAKSMIYLVWALLQCLIPMVSGGYTDRYGYRKSLAVAFVINVIGYSGMAMSKPIADHLATMGWADAGFWVFMAAACCVATGTAIFKPPAHGTIAKGTTEETASLGWGIFYWVVNIGGALAPMGAATLRHEIDWNIVFWAAAIVTALNFLPAFLLYREPQKVAPAAGSEQPKGAIGVFVNSIATIFKDLRLVIFLGIFSCFWLMFMQLWDLLPNFIDEWVDTASVARYFGWFSHGWVLGSGQVKPEMIINIDAIAIIALVIPISWMIGKISKVAAMIIGMIISLFAFVASGWSMLGWLCCFSIFIFAIGEMICSPTFSAYVGLIAPPDKKALYMGYSNIPFAIGWAAGNGIGGVIYDAIGSKYDLARRYMVEHLGMTKEFVMDKVRLPKDQVMETLARAMKGGDGPGVQQSLMNWWSSVDTQNIPKDQLAETAKKGFTEVLGQVDPAAMKQATQVLWDLHHPYMVWVYLGLMGLIGTIGMIIFYFATAKSKTTSQAASAVG